ncbi:MAG: hypothetical protein GYA12_12490 [Chloroflexi bacterium]|nr:hypothetical protein [Chloroflexota bacterium]
MGRLTSRTITPREYIGFTILISPYLISKPCRLMEHPRGSPLVRGMHDGEH